MWLPDLPPFRSGGVDLVTLGENSLDVVGHCHAADPGLTKHTLAAFALQVGGQTATAAAAAARLGVSTRYVGAFGTDDWGVRVRDALVARGIDVRAVIRQGVSSRVAIVLVDGAGERVVYEHRQAALELGDDDIPAPWIEDARCLLVDGTSPRAARAAARMARRAGIPTLVDVDRLSDDTNRLLAEIDVIIVPEPFVAAWSGAADLGAGLHDLARAFPRAVAVVATRGAIGSLALIDGVRLVTPGYPVDALDTTGAGDAFRGGFAAAWIQLAARGRVSAADVLARANATAALNCRAAGAQGALPTLGEVEQLVTGTPRERSN
jgi:ribokinase